MYACLAITLITIGTLLGAGTARSQTGGALTCESQVAQCHSCQNGRAATTGLCLYDNVADCRLQVMQFCKAGNSGQRGSRSITGHLSSAEVSRLTMSCPNIPHGGIPYQQPIQPGTKDMERCIAFNKVYTACAMLRVFGGPKLDFAKCLRQSYTGP
jgi:hypothetical protein